MKRFRWFTEAALIGALGFAVLSACGGGDDNSTGGEVEVTQTAVAQVTRTPQPTPTPEPTAAATPTPAVEPSPTVEETECLAEPLTTASGRPSVGEITDVQNELVQVDCTEQFGTGVIAERAVVATDGNGVADLQLDHVGSCRLQRNSTIHVEPDPLTLLNFVAGETICDVNSSDRTRSFRAGDTPLLVGTQAAAMVISQPSDQSQPTVTVLTGFAAFDPPDLACRVIIGPGQQSQLSSDSRTVEAFELSAALAADVIDFRGTAVTPRAGTELLPGLHDLLATQEVTIVRDGELLGANRVEADQAKIFETIVGAEVVFQDTPGRFELGDRLEFEAPVIELTRPLGALGQLPLVEARQSVRADEVSAALETDKPIEELRETPVLVDPDGSTWTVVYDAQREDVTERLQVELAATLSSGAYGAFYQDNFGRQPRYGELVPDLLDDNVECVG